MKDYHYWGTFALEHLFITCNLLHINGEPEDLINQGPHGTSLRQGMFPVVVLLVSYFQVISAKNNFMDWWIVKLGGLWRMTNSFWRDWDFDFLLILLIPFHDVVPGPVKTVDHWLTGVFLMKHHCYWNPKANRAVVSLGFRTYAALGLGMVRHELPNGQVTSQWFLFSLSLYYYLASKIILPAHWTRMMNIHIYSSTILIVTACFVSV